jgi:hypothetical protein
LARLTALLQDVFLKRSRLSDLDLTIGPGCFGRLAHACQRLHYAIIVTAASLFSSLKKGELQLHTTPVRHSVNEFQNAK